jgi:hypothetical protein
VDPALGELIESGPADEEVSAIIRLKEGAEPPPNVRVVSRFGEVATIRLRRDEILPTWENDRVVSVKASRKVFASPAQANGAGEAEELVEEEMEAEDESSQRRPPPLPALPEDGTGVVVGVCDWGLDFAHANFRNADGTSRVQSLWDQRGQGDPRAPAPFGYGRVHTRAAIDAALASRDPYAALDYYPWRSDPTSTGSHGTHVSDIVVGNRREPGSEVGLASGADFHFVHLGPQRLRELEDLGDSVGLLEGLDYVVRQAAGRPCVLHLSAGKTGGPKRGTTLMERAVDAMLLEHPAVVLVQSVGNYADTAMHTHARVGPDQRYVLNWLIPEGDRTPNELEIWYSGKDEFEATLISPTGQEFSASLGRRSRLGDGMDRWGNFYHRRNEPNSGLNHIVVFLYVAAPPGLWRVALRGREVVDGRLHAWIERDAGVRNQSRFPRNQATSRYTTNTICNCYRAIAVGAHDSSLPDRPPTRFSSSGPTADGRQKPEISAPGARILAARSAPRGGWNGEPRLCIKSGTSMAAPWVSGTVALMHQAAGRPLTIHEVRRILIGTSDAIPGATGRSSSRLGYGYLNVAAAVEAARRLGALQPSVPRAAEAGDAFEIEEPKEMGATIETEAAEVAGAGPVVESQAIESGEVVEGEAEEAWPSVWVEKIGAESQPEAESFTVEDERDDRDEDQGDEDWNEGLIAPDPEAGEGLAAAEFGRWAEDEVEAEDADWP